MVKVESSPVPTCSSKHEPVDCMLCIASPSSTTEQSPSIRASTPSSKECIVSSSGVLVGTSTSLIVGSAYSPSTFCIDHV